MIVVRALALIAGLVSTAGPLAHAQDYPARPVTIVVPTGPGGGMEMVARLLAPKLEQRLGKPFVIENRPGAGTNIGAAAVARSAPDGYTLLMATSSTMAINSSIYKSLPFDPLKDLMPVVLYARVPFVLVVNPSLPAQTAADLVKLAKEKPGTLSFGTSGTGTASHIGQFTLVDDGFANLSTGSGGGRVTFTAANGDSFTATEIGSAVIESGFADVTDDATITGGTGRFAGATGTITILKRVDISTGFSSGSFEGTITLAR